MDTICTEWHYKGEDCTCKQTDAELKDVTQLVQDGTDDEGTGQATYSSGYY